MNKTTRFAILGVILVVGIFDLNPTKIKELVAPYIPDNPIIGPKEPVLDVAEPTDDLKLAVKDLSDLITEKEDRLEIAVLAYEFSKRIKDSKYDNKMFQDYNDVYVEASMTFYTTKMSDKYEGFGKSISTLLKDAIGGDDNVALTDIERTNLTEHLEALAWQMIN